MDNWTLHWLEANGSLAAWRSDVVQQAEAAYATVAALMPPPPLDILLQPAPGLDPQNPSLPAALQDGTLHRQLLHEVHHCLRMAGPGYGWTLGEALVSEGLAGQFVTTLLGSAPERWECALSASQLRQLPLTAAMLAERHYDHAAWFFGTASLPRWAGYSLGYAMAGAWREQIGAPSATQWVEVSANEVIAAAIVRGVIAG
jgi:hypothetical protein